MCDEHEQTYILELIHSIRFAIHEPPDIVRSMNSCLFACTGAGHLAQLPQSGLKTPEKLFLTVNHLHIPLLGSCHPTHISFTKEFHPLHRSSFGSWEATQKTRRNINPGRPFFRHLCGRSLFSSRRAAAFLRASPWKQVREVTSTPKIASGHNPQEGQCWQKKATPHPKKSSRGTREQNHIGLVPSPLRASRCLHKPSRYAGTLGTNPPKAPIHQGRNERKPRNPMGYLFIYLLKQSSRLGPRTSTSYNSKTQRLRSPYIDQTQPTLEFTKLFSWPNALQAKLAFNNKCGLSLCLWNSGGSSLLRHTAIDVLFPRSAARATEGPPASSSTSEGSWALTAVSGLR